MLSATLYNTLMDNLADLLGSIKSDEPPQVAALKKYIRETHHKEIQVRVSKTHYLITVPGAALAQTLRIETAEIMQVCKLDRRLVIHIGY
jgi:hypothetical protein